MEEGKAHAPSSTSRVPRVVAGRASDPVVTRLRARGADRVEVELGGRPWRVIPAEAVLASGLAIGRVVDRATARDVGRALRRLEARGVALRALRSRDHTVASLDERLAERGTAPRVRRETVAAARRAGLVDDRRLARERAVVLAGRGAGNAMIASDLERRGVSDAEIRGALAVLEPESARAARIVEERGRTVKTARFLAARGFAEDALESLVADMSPDEIE